jgi:hypothetical protein
VKEADLRIILPSNALSIAVYAARRVIVCESIASAHHNLSRQGTVCVDLVPAFQDENLRALQEYHDEDLRALAKRP